MPRRSPSPSSPTLPTKSTGQGSVIEASISAAAMASRPVTPAALSQAPGAIRRVPLSLRSDLRSGGKDGVDMGGEHDSALAVVD